MSILSRVSRSSVLKQLISRSTPSAGVSMSFHTGVPLRDNEKDNTSGTTAVQVEEKGFLEKMGIDDWKIATPIAFALAVPALTNEFYIINEETQLACCFFLFVSSAYKFGGEAISSYYDARAAAVLKEQNQAEDEAIAQMEEAIQVYKENSSSYEIFSELEKSHQELLEKVCKLEELKVKHQVRQSFVQQLDAAAMFESDIRGKLQTNMVQYANNYAKNALQKSGDKIKQTALDNAIKMLKDADFEVSGDADEICKLYTAGIQEYSKMVQEKQGKMIKLTPEEKEIIKQDMERYANRVNADISQVEVPSDIKFELH